MKEQAKQARWMSRASSQMAMIKQKNVQEHVNKKTNDDGRLKYR